MTVKRALITGIAGQDGSYLAELLLEQGYEVHGIVRRAAIEDPEHSLSRLLPVRGRVHLHAAALDSLPSIYRVFQQVAPDECYHLAAQSFVACAFEDELATLTSNITSTYHVLAALRGCAPTCRFYFAATSEMFGRVSARPQNESTLLHPRSAYGISKVAGFHLARNYRETYGIKVACGILYNHESPRRGFEFVTRKISSYAARIKLGLARELRLGNLDAQRDRGHAREYVRAMWMMLQQEEPEDYVVATGELHSVREFAEAAFAHVGLNYQDYVVVDQQFVRPLDPVPLVGDTAKAKQHLGWTYRGSFKALVQEMVEADLRLLGTSPSQASSRAPGS